MRLSPQTLAPFLDSILGAPAMRDSAATVDWPALLRQIRCPALLITGDTALGAMVSTSQAAALQQQVPTLRVAYIANASHDVQRDQPDAFLTVIEPFLAEWASAYLR